jgi:hypothetical protein
MDANDLTLRCYTFVLLDKIIEVKKKCIAADNGNVVAEMYKNSSKTL